MLTKLFAITAVGVAIASIWGGYTQQAAFQLRQERQSSSYRSRRGTRLYGNYRQGVWVPVPVRSNYNGFRGGGPGSGK